MEVHLWKQSTINDVGLVWKGNIMGMAEHGTSGLDKPSQSLSNLKFQSLTSPAEMPQAEATSFISLIPSLLPSLIPPLPQSLSPGHNCSCVSVDASFLCFYFGSR